MGMGQWCSTSSWAWGSVDQRPHGHGAVLINVIMGMGHFDQRLMGMGQCLSTASNHGAASLWAWGRVDQRPNGHGAALINDFMGMGQC
ncbi:hypothetical protein RRG08_053791 [Elysia crispata]|uniref:Uncharacterized protein n=1 Tax=Elysia crispata TaxID=231223 RepID=A0AAE1DEB9_9GAST|nr:hypothetical protein RRG08_053791 [Elysia crispata]